jgi:hypothetical protein
VQNGRFPSPFMERRPERAMRKKVASRDGEDL